MYYEIHGSGPPLILLHGGWGTGNAQWKDHIDIYKEFFQVILPDLRGHGRSSNTTGKLSIKQLAEDIVELVDKLGIIKPFISGWSMGGAVAAFLAINYPNIASAYIVGGTRFTVPQDDPKELEKIGVLGPGDVDLEKYFEQRSPEFLELIKSIHSTYPEQINDLAVQYSHFSFNPLEYSDQELMQTNSKILMIVGDRDTISLDDVLREFQLLTHGELAIIPGADHSMCRSRPIEYANIVTEYLRRQLDKR